MDIAVEAHLMVVLDHGLDRFRIVLDAPGRHEEGLLEAVAAIAFEDARHADLRSVFEHRYGRYAGDRILRMLDMDEAVGIHVEGDGDGDLGAVGPGHGSSDHGIVLTRESGNALRRASPC